MKPSPACARGSSRMPICWMQEPYLRPASRLFEADRCTMPGSEAFPRSLRGSRNSLGATANASGRTRVGANWRSDPSLSVTHYVGGAAAVYGRIRSQNHRLELIGAGKQLDG